MRNWDTRDESGTDKGCEWEKDWEDVQRVCKVLDIPCQMVRMYTISTPHHLIQLKVDLSREYWTRVFEPSLKAWELGVTPNPDVWCNKWDFYVLPFGIADLSLREIKFGALLERLPIAPSNAWFATGYLYTPLSLFYAH
jgi:tRNA-specific 2-thiouridylase